MSNPEVLPTAKKWATRVIVTGGASAMAVTGVVTYNEIQRLLHHPQVRIPIPGTGITPPTGRARINPNFTVTDTVKLDCPTEETVYAGVRTNSNMKAAWISVGGTGVNHMVGVRYLECGEDGFLAKAQVTRNPNFCATSDPNTCPVESVKVSLPDYAPRSVGVNALDNVLCEPLKADATEADKKQADQVYADKLAKGQDPCSYDLVQTHGILDAGTNKEASATTILALRLAQTAGQITPLTPDQQQSVVNDFVAMTTDQLRIMYPGAKSYEVDPPAPLTPLQTLENNLAPIMPDLTRDFNRMTFARDNGLAKFTVHEGPASGDIFMPLSLTDTDITALDGYLAQFTPLPAHA